jgi:acetolactate synthase-1/2/3 large subunit
MPTDTAKDKTKMNRRDAIKVASAIAATTAAAAAAIVAPDKAIAAEHSNATAAAAGGAAGTAKKLPVPINNGAAVFLRTLNANGVDTVFGCPGTSEMQVVDEVGYTDMNVVLCLFENSVTGMADGYARMMDKPALCLLHVACGLTNSLANMHNARVAGSPMIIFGGGIHYAHEVNQPVHSMLLRQPEIARAAADWVYEAKNPDELAAAATEVLEAANEGSGKICYLYAPNNAVWGDTRFEGEVVDCEETRQPVANSTIDEIAESLNEGKKTVFILDNLALREEGLDLVGRIAEGTGGALYRDFLPPRVASGAGRVKVNMIPYEPTQALEQFSEYDQMVLVGVSFPPSTAFSYEDGLWVKVPEGMPVRTLATADNDILAALKRLTKKVKGLPRKATNRYERDPGMAPTGALGGASIGQSLNVLLPDNAIVLDEAIAENFTWPQVTQGIATHDFIAPMVGGAIGAGPPVACGVAIAAPDRKVVLLEGDFSLMQGNTALWSMAQHNLDICVVNFNNQGSASLTTELARVRRGEAQPKSMEMLNINNPPVDYAAMAESMGVPATRAGTAEEFHEQFAAAMKEKGPHFIDADITKASIKDKLSAMHRANYEAKYDVK